KDIFRPSHADFGYETKYGIRDYRGGGRSSGRETVSRVIGGAVAKKILKEKFGLNIFGFSCEIGGDKFTDFNQDFIEKNPLRMASEKDFEATLAKVEAARNDGDSMGGVVEVHIANVPAGLGQPVFGKLEAELAKAMMTVGATKFFEIGEGREICTEKGSEANDSFVKDSKVHTEKNNNGGILGGISTGDDIFFRVGVKPTPSISKKQNTVNTSGEAEEIQVTGRHDPIIVPRIIPVLESMAALVILDQVMLQKAQCSL
ncbi:MAG: chorismate synthase, partial [Candidatus Peregrinibacteria bacterium]|nr:chorismate synthase [Candidatus Peregrinibacteria bacterium]